MTLNYLVRFLNSYHTQKRKNRQ